MKTELVQPKSLPGTMELLPSEQLLFDEIKNKIEKVYKSYGFLPIDTPIIEKSEVLLAKAGGETEKQIYRFNKGDNDICLRFDLTVPLAKFVAENISNLEFPFKRYQIGKVYRGEKAQKGRYREFYQCDIDTIGNGSLSLKNDAEYPAIIYSLFKELDFGKFTIYLNNRKIVNGLLEELSLLDKKEDIMRLLDKYDKIGEEKVKLSLIEDYKIEDNVVNKLLEFIKINGSTDEVLDKLDSFPINNETFKLGVSELKEVVNYIRMQGVEENYFAINLSIVRGLDYYTGTVYETFLDDYTSLGSVCSGGRYENLAGFYTENKLPGVGISIGLTRLFYQLNENNLIKKQKESLCDVLVLPMDETSVSKAFVVAKKLRENGLIVQTYLEDKKFKNKMQYADKLHIPYCIIIGEDETQNGYVSAKNMLDGKQEKVNDNDIANYFNKK